LQIKAVPTILLISNKQFVDAFSGFPDEATLTRFMTNLKKGLDS
jgi:thioredoxin-like negative regulator of GroEL